jgi:hypothetical protein
MAEILRVRAPQPTDSIIYDGRRYPATDSVAEIPNTDGKLRQAKGADVLPHACVSLSHLDLPELRCTVCGRKKLALMGPLCAWCGGECV